MFVTRRQFEKLKEGDMVILNGMCRQNAGFKCKITYKISDDERIWIEPIDGELSGLFCCSDWNEISYKAANVI